VALADVLVASCKSRDHLRRRIELPAGLADARASADEGSISRTSGRAASATAPQ
jgi:hypothetical protein